MSTQVITVFPDTNVLVGLHHVRSIIRHPDHEGDSARFYVAVDGSAALTEVEVRLVNREDDHEGDLAVLEFGLFAKDASEPCLTFSFTEDLRA